MMKNVINMYLYQQNVMKMQFDLLIFFLEKKRSQKKLGMLKMILKYIV
jgi:hypothetical protein